MKLHYILCISALFFWTPKANSQSWWPQNSHTLSDLNEIFYATNSTGWSFGDSLDGIGGFASEYLTKSTNQGALWFQQDMGSPIYQILGSYFVNDQKGFGVGRNQLSGNGVIITTIDGGTTWSAGPAQPERLVDVYFADANTGWTVGRNDFVLRTSDGGTNWTDISASTGDHLNGVFFTTTTNGYVVGKAGIIISSVDAGTNWTNLSSGTNEDLNAVSFVNDSTGWVVGKAGVILFTNDWGINWNTQTSGTAEDLTDVTFVNDTTGWAVGTAGTVLKTTDAGVNWIPETSGTQEDIMSISMRNETLGWFCGNAGVIYVYGISPPNALDELSATVSMNLYPNPATDKIKVELYQQHPGSTS